MADTHILLFVFITSSCIAVTATVFVLENSCPFTVWPGILSGNSTTLGDGGVPLTPGASVQLTAPPGWSGRFWARTGCSFDASGRGGCVTGDCGGVLNCNRGGFPPATLAEFTVGSGDSGVDFYDVSLVDGYNVKMGIEPLGGTGDCHYAGCLADINEICPGDLRIMDPNVDGVVAACMSACAAFDSPEFCCTGAHATPQTCSPSQYSMVFKNACPSAYSYAYDDDATSIFTCSRSNYLITFCPTRS
ncbi:pathogenesis-related protein 5 isoform X1 [Raphanus sativus]|uniref:Pathogenesis-related protein 5 isoform X1 n=1 Tax=Raphanus sativus TaxID=3726 RepID=A0A6J0K8S5_RAPSA|nr:pathogenesis-related protein 5 isoform X1 [Raphanus sativus]